MGKEQELKKVLKEKMQEDELVLWHAKTEPFKLLEGTSGKSIVKKWIISALVIGTLLALYIGFIEILEPGIIVLLLLVQVFIMVTPIMDQKALGRQEYWVTNKKVVLTKREEVSCIELDRMSKYWIVAEDGMKGHHVVMGEELFKEVGKPLRGRACHPMTNSETKEVKGLVFYNVPNAEAIDGILRSHVKQ